MEALPIKSEKIEKTKIRFPKQWLLIAVDKIDELTTTPISGKLIAHSPRRSEIYQQMMKVRGKKPILVEYSEDNLPQGFAVAFSFYE